MKVRKRSKKKASPWDLEPHLVPGEVLHGLFEATDLLMNRAECLANLTDRRLIVQYDARPSQPATVDYADIIGLAANFDKGEIVLESRRPTTIIEGYDMTLPGTLLLCLMCSEDGRVPDDFEAGVQWLYRKVRQQLETDGDAMYEKLRAELLG